MKRFFWLSNKSFNYKLLLICIFSLSLTISKVGLAEFQPPSDASSPSGLSGSSSSRGGSCDQDRTTELTLLGPINPIGYVGQLNSNEITFAWFVPSQIPKQTSVAFRLSNSTHAIIWQTDLKLSSGIMTISIPKGKLLVGQKYLWEVSICYNNLDHPSKFLRLGTELAVIDVPSNLALELAKTKDSLQRAALYAKAGLWYNAVSEAVTTKEQEESKVKQYLVTLLKDLKGIEEKKLKEKFPNLEKENLETFCDSTAIRKEGFKDVCEQVRSLDKIIKTQALLSAPITPAKLDH